MMTLLQINTVVNWGSTGRICEGIGIEAQHHGWKSFIAYGRHNLNSSSHVIGVGSKAEFLIHVLKTRFLDQHGLGSSLATKRLIEWIRRNRPDVIHIHNMHGYYLNIKLLLNFLSKINTPLIITLHDCWVLTGHCTHFEFVDCKKWETGCFNCPQIRSYPASMFIDRSYTNQKLKISLLNSIQNITYVTVSNWLANKVRQSMLMTHSIKLINNGIDLTQFIPQNVSIAKRSLGLERKFVILGVAQSWSTRKGLRDFLKLSGLLDSEDMILLVGLNRSQLRQLPKNIIGIKRTNSIKELRELYNSADVFVNPTWEDSFPTTNLEALACGTPVVTYRTGGSPEAIDERTGMVVNKGDMDELLRAIRAIKSLGKDHFSSACRARAQKLYDSSDRYKDYVLLYESLIDNKSESGKD